MRTDDCVMIRITITTPIRNVEHRFTPRLLLRMTLAVSGSRANLAALATMCQSNSWSPFSPLHLSTIGGVQWEVNADLVSYNYRASLLFREFYDQVERYSCSGGIWTQTTDVEGEVNGLYTYDRRLLRPDPKQWKSDINKLYSAAAGRR